MQKRATRFIPEIIKLDYQERLENLNLPILTYRWFRGSMVETYKILHNMHDANVPIHSLNLKSQIHVEICLQLKHNYQELALNETFLVHE